MQALDKYLKTYSKTTQVFPSRCKKVQDTTGKENLDTSDVALPKPSIYSLSWFYAKKLENIPQKWNPGPLSYVDQGVQHASFHWPWVTADYFCIDQVEIYGLGVLY